LLRSADRNLQDKKTTINAIRFRIDQEIKFLCRKKQHLNQRLYHPHLENAHQYKGMWQHIQEYTDEKINRLMDNIYQKLNKKLDALINQPNTRYNNGNAPIFQPRLINLTSTPSHCSTTHSYTTWYAATTPRLQIPIELWIL